MHYYLSSDAVKVKMSVQAQGMFPGVQRIGQVWSDGFSCTSHRDRVFQGHSAVDCQSDEKMLQRASHFGVAVSSRRLEDRRLVLGSRQGLPY